MPTLLLGIKIDLLSGACLLSGSFLQIFVIQMLWIQCLQILTQDHYYGELNVSSWKNIYCLLWGLDSAGLVVFECSQDLIAKKNAPMINCANATVRGSFDDEYSLWTCFITNTGIAFCFISFLAAMGLLETCQYLLNTNSCFSISC